MGLFHAGQEAPSKKNIYIVVKAYLIHTQVANKNRTNSW